MLCPDSRTSAEAKVRMGRRRLPPAAMMCRPVAESAPPGFGYVAYDDLVDLGEVVLSPAPPDAPAHRHPPSAFRLEIDDHCHATNPAYFQVSSITSCMLGRSIEA